LHSDFEAFACGIALGAEAAVRLLDHGRQAYAAAGRSRRRRMSGRAARGKPRAMTRT